PGRGAHGRGTAGRAHGGGQSARADDPGPARPGARAGPGCAVADDRRRAGAQELRLMARINLLPWRAERRRQRQKEFLAMLAFSGALALALSFVIVSFYNGQITGQNERIAFLKKQISDVDAQIKEIEELDDKKSRLLARKEVIEQLQANRSKMVHLFDSLVRTIPDGVILTSV